MAQADRTQQREMLRKFYSEGRFADITLRTPVGAQGTFLVHTVGSSRPLRASWDLSGPSKQAPGCLKFGIPWSQPFGAHVARDDRASRRFVEDRRASVEAASHDEVVLEDEKYSERLVEQAIEAFHSRSSSSSSSFLDEASLGFKLVSMA